MKQTDKSIHIRQWHDDRSTHVTVCRNGSWGHPYQATDASRRRMNLLLDRWIGPGHFKDTNAHLSDNSASIFAHDYVQTEVHNA